MFVVECKSTRSSVKARFLKRFSDFVELHQRVQASFAGSHLAKYGMPLRLQSTSAGSDD